MLKLPSGLRITSIALFEMVPCSAIHRCSPVVASCNAEDRPAVGISGFREISTIARLCARVADSRRSQLHVPVSNPMHVLQASVQTALI